MMWFPLFTIDTRKPHRNWDRGLLRGKRKIFTTGMFGQQLIIICGCPQFGCRTPSHLWLQSNSVNSNYSFQLKWSPVLIAMDSKHRAISCLSKETTAASTKLNLFQILSKGRLWIKIPSHCCCRAFFQANSRNQPDKRIAKLHLLKTSCQKQRHSEKELSGKENIPWIQQERDCLKVQVVFTTFVFV